MSELLQTARKFLSFNKMAVAGVSSKGDTAGNIIFRKLQSQGYDLYPVNPNTAVIEGVKCYPSIESLPETPDVVIIATHPDVTPSIMHDCGKAGIQRVWIHRSFGTGSFHPDANEIAKQYNFTLIPGGCPMMFSEPDVIHRCMLWFLQVTGNEAKPIISKEF